MDAQEGEGGKVYCEECDTVFGSRPEFERHRGRHGGAASESCPLDSAISRIMRLFRK